MAMIEVPDFDGYECIGLVSPDENMPCKTLLFSIETGEAYLTTSFGSLRKICYRKIKPKRIVLESTGEVRAPKHGEWYKTESDGYTKAIADMDHIFIREIYRIVEE